MYIQALCLSVIKAALRYLFSHCHFILCQLGFIWEKLVKVSLKCVKLHSKALITEETFFLRRAHAGRGTALFLHLWHFLNGKEEVLKERYKANKSGRIFHTFFISALPSGTFVTGENSINGSVLIGRSTPWQFQTLRILNLFDSPFWGFVVGRTGVGHVDGVGPAVRTGTFGGQVAPAVADDVVDELLAVHADLHAAPVLCELLRQLQLAFGGWALAVLWWSERGIVTRNDLTGRHYHSTDQEFTNFFVSWTL